MSKMLNRILHFFSSFQLTNVACVVSMSTGHRSTNPANLSVWLENYRCNLLNGCTTRRIKAWGKEFRAQNFTVKNSARLNVVIFESIVGGLRIECVSAWGASMRAYILE